MTKKKYFIRNNKEKSIYSRGWKAGFDEGYGRAMLLKTDDMLSAYLKVIRNE